MLVLQIDTVFLNGMLLGHLAGQQIYIIREAYYFFNDPWGN